MGSIGTRGTRYKEIETFFKQPKGHNKDIDELAKPINDIVTKLESAIIKATASSVEWDDLPQSVQNIQVIHNSASSVLSSRPKLSLHFMDMYAKGQAVISAWNSFQDSTKTRTHQQALTKVFHGFANYKVPTVEEDQFAREFHNAGMESPTVHDVGDMLHLEKSNANMICT